MTQAAERPTSRSWLRSIGAVTANTVVSMACLVLTAVVTARQLGPDGRGVLVLVTTVASFCMLLSSLGTNVKARVDLARSSGIRAEEYLGLGLVLLCLQAAVTLTAGVAALYAGGALYAWGVPLALAVYGLGLLASVLLRDLLYALGRPGVASGGEAVGAVSLLVATAGLALADVRSTTPYLLALVLSGLVQGFVLLLALARLGNLVRPSADLQTWRRHVRASLPAMLQAFAQAGAFRGDRLILGLIAGPAAVGVYSVAATMTELMWLVPMSIGNVLFQRVASGTLQPATLRRLRLANLALAVLSAVVMVLVGPAVIRTVFGPEFEESADLLYVLAAAAVLVSSYHIDIVRVTAAGALGQAGRIVSVGFVVTVVADVALVPRYGALGAAIGSVLGYGVLAGGSALAARRLAREGKEARL